QAEDGIRDDLVTGVQTCALPILIMGTARFVGPKTVEVCLNDGGRRTLAGERVFLNLGTQAAIPPVPGLADARPLTNIELLELDRSEERRVGKDGRSRGRADQYEE